MVFNINGETGSLLRQGKGTLKSISQGSPWNYLKSIIFNVLRCPSFLSTKMRGLQIYALWATITCKIKQAGLAHWAVSFCHLSFLTIQKAIMSCIFLQFSHEVDMKNIANVWKYWYSIHLFHNVFWKSGQKNMSLHCAKIKRSRYFRKDSRQYILWAFFENSFRRPHGSCTFGTSSFAHVQAVSTFFSLFLRCVNCIVEKSGHY